MNFQCPDNKNQKPKFLRPKILLCEAMCLSLRVSFSDDVCRSVPENISLRQKVRAGRRTQQPRSIQEIVRRKHIFEFEQIVWETGD